jgi:hypothetical protein
MIDELGQKIADNAKKEVSETFSRAVFFELMKNLNDEEKEEYAKMIEAGSSWDEQEVFLREKIKNYDEIIQKTFNIFK